MRSHHLKRIWLLAVWTLVVFGLVFASLYSISEKGQAMDTEEKIAAKYGLEKPSVQEQPLKKLLNGDFGVSWSIDYPVVLMVLVGLTIILFIIYKASKKLKSKE